MLSVFIYLSHTIIHHDWGAIRAGLAASLVLPMIYFLQRKNYLNYFILLFISFSVHYISIISLLLLFSNYKYKSSTLFLILLSGYVFSQLNGLDHLINLLESYSLVPLQLSNYLNWSKYNYDVSLLHPKTFQQICLSLLILYLFQKSHNLKKYYFIINVYILSTFLAVTMSSFSLLCFRTSMHFYFS